MTRIFARFLAISCMAALSFSGVAAACDSTSKRLSSDLANRALVKAQDSYRNLNGLTSRFVQSSYLAALEASEVSQGQVRYRKPGMMRWDYDYPRRESFVINGGVASFYQPDLNQVLIDDLSKMTSGDLPLLFLSGVGDLQTQFKLREACEGQSSTVLYLTPRKTGALGAVKLQFNNKSGLPEKFDVEDVSGNTNSITLSQLKSADIPGESAFKLDIPKGTDIQDRRGSNE